MKNAKHDENTKRLPVTVLNADGTIHSLHAKATTAHRHCDVNPGAVMIPTRTDSEARRRAAQVCWLIDCGASSMRTNDNRLVHVDGRVECC